MVRHIEAEYIDSTKSRKNRALQRLLDSHGAAYLDNLVHPMATVVYRVVRRAEEAKRRNAF